MCAGMLQDDAAEEIAFIETVGKYEASMVLPFSIASSIFVVSLLLQISKRRDFILSTI